MAEGYGRWIDLGDQDVAMVSAADFSLGSLYQIFGDAYFDPELVLEKPHLSADARICGAAHAANGDTAYWRWRPGYSCPVLNRTTPVWNESSWVACHTEAEHGFMLAWAYNVSTRQTVYIVRPYPDAPAGEKVSKVITSSATAAAQITPLLPSVPYGSDGTWKYELTFNDVTVSLGAGGGYSSDTGPFEVLAFVDQCPPGIISSGDHWLNTNIDGAGYDFSATYSSGGAVSSGSATSTIDDLTYGLRVRVLHSDIVRKMDLGYDPSFTDGMADTYGSQVAPTLTGTMNVSIRIAWHYPDLDLVAPTLRQRQRDDGLVAGGAPRASRSVTSRQLSIRQRGYW